MTSLREAAQQALVDMACMRDMVAHPDNLQFIENAIAALRTALAEPEQEPVAWKDTTYGNLHHQNFGGCIPLYTHPPQRKPLTDEEIDALPLPPSGTATVRDIVRLIERAHGIGGEA